MPGPDALLEQARRHIGYTETPPGSNRTRFGEQFGWDGVPWCSEFVWCVFADSGQPGLYPKTASTRVSYPWFADRGQLVSVAAARPGDVVWFDFSATLKPVSHVGIVEANPGGGRLVTIEGNTSLSSDDNGGAVMRRTRSARIVAVGRPAWQEAAVAPFGVDYSYSRPSPAAMARDGVDFACRYLRGSGLKALTRAEADALHGARIATVSNEETTGTQVTGGYAGGQRDAAAADAAHRACGGPASRPIYFSPWDHDTAGWSAAQWTQLGRYLDGAADVLGRGRVGLYQGYGAIKRAFDEGWIRWGWQSFAWSGGRWDSRCHIQQYRNGVSRWGGLVDYNRATKADYGQWGTGIPISEVDDMPGPSAWTSADWTAFWEAFDPHYKALLWKRYEASFASEAEVLRDWPVLRADMKAVKAGVGELSDDEAKIVAAVGGVTGGGMSTEQMNEAAGQIAAVLGMTLPDAVLAALKSAL